jgi:NAD+ synthase
MPNNLTSDVLRIDEATEVERIAGWLRNIVRTELRKRGLIIAMSGGIDSSVCAALAVRALGPDKVLGLLLPERDSAADSSKRGKVLAQHLGIDHIVEDIAPTLEAVGCYRWRDEAIRQVFPDYASGWKSKIVIAGGLKGGINYFNLIVQSPTGSQKESRLEIKQYLQIVAATNYKQRLRKTIEYFHADRLNYGVVGTPNRLEYDQGFFVKNGDGSADVKPIAHLYKTQVYALARHMKLPPEICDATPTTDTYSLAQGQDEFYFALPYAEMDLALWAHNHRIAAGELAPVLGIDVHQADLVYKDIDRKRATTRYLHARPYLIEQVSKYVDDHPPSMAKDGVA